jgi:hypothetical protein
VQQREWTANGWLLLFFSLFFLFFFFFFFFFLFLFRFSFLADRSPIAAHSPSPASSLQSSWCEHNTRTTGSAQARAVGARDSDWDSDSDRRDG